MKFIAKIAVLTAMLLGLPILGVHLTNKPIRDYLQFPPLTHQITHPPFSWPVFLGMALFLVFYVTILALPAIRRRHATANEPKPVPPHPFPWWGWLAIAVGIGAWILAWTRFEWFAPLQGQTFLPLWLVYIVVVNALSYRRTGHCMMRDRPLIFLLLFPVSAIFWWFFEYMNRFVQNWYYAGVTHTAWSYVFHATTHFSTVLPAVLCTREWLNDFPIIKRAFTSCRPITFRHSKIAAWAVLIISALALTAIGWAPHLLFPLVWIAPGVIIIALQAALGDEHVFSPFTRGNYRAVVTAMVAALICGFFWEMWNWQSLAKWIYVVPYVYRFKIFEMPIIGYTGYLPFGIECLVIGVALERYMTRSPSRP